jgi:hypothetical protein
MATIPENQRLLLIWADEIENPCGLFTRADIAREIRAITANLSRRKYVRKAPDKARHVDRTLSAQLRAAAAGRPDLTYQEIAVMHGVTAGRVSEALAGKRK